LWFSDIHVYCIRGVHAFQGKLNMDLATDRSEYFLYAFRWQLYGPVHFLPLLKLLHQKSTRLCDQQTFLLRIWETTSASPLMPKNNVRD
jgi:hypothetical protein